MHIDEDYFEAILADLVDDNPLACQGVLSISALEFTGRVPTLAVTLNEERPRLLVNPGFVREHCRNETDVKTVLLHEFLHVLLNHTGEYEVCDEATNLALDAVINHIIHRSCGSDYSEFFRTYYAGAEGWQKLLVPPRPGDECRCNPWQDELTQLLADIGDGLCNGTVLADDILELARDAASTGSDATVLPQGTDFLGNHEPDLQANATTRRPSPLIVKALDDTFKQLNGGGIFREPSRHGFAQADSVRQEWAAREEQVGRWEKITLAALRPLLTPDPRSRRTEFEDLRSLLPVLHGGDRRGFLRSLWSPLLPEIRWDFPVRKPSGTTLVYLDVSGSMHAEMGALVALLGRLRQWIRLPFWAFSNVVAPATIERGVLKTETTGGTAMNCVLAHLAETRPEKALVVTDGYIETPDPALLGAARNTKIHALVSRDGDPTLLEGGGIACTQLPEFPG